MAYGYVLHYTVPFSRRVTFSRIALALFRRYFREYQPFFFYFVLDFNYNTFFLYVNYFSSIEIVFKSSWKSDTLQKLYCTFYVAGTCTFESVACGEFAALSSGSRSFVNITNTAACKLMCNKYTANNTACWALGFKRSAGVCTIYTHVNPFAFDNVICSGPGIYFIRRCFEGNYRNELERDYIRKHVCLSQGEHKNIG